MGTDGGGGQRRAGGDIARGALHRSGPSVGSLGRPARGWHVELPHSGACGMKEVKVSCVSL